MQSHMKKIFLAASIIAGTSLIGIGVGYYYISSDHMIYDYDERIDKKPIVDLFDSDRYWLTASPDYPVEYMLKYKAPTKDPLSIGRLHIKVLREHDKFIGFTAYYMLFDNEAKLLFVAVNPEFRGKRYGERLLKYAIKDLKSMGARYIRLTTRTTNLQAQRLYNRVGFKETSRDEEGYVYFTYTI
jgi:ribosomal protein S18 acetylase RimI-like enzyme